MKLMKMWKHLAGIMLLLMVASPFAFNAFASESSPIVGSITCVVEDLDGQVSVALTVDTAGLETDTVRIEMIYDESVLSNPSATPGLDFSSPGLTAAITLPDGTGRGLFVVTHGRTGSSISGETSFGTVTFDWTGDPTEIAFNSADSGIAQGSNLIFVGEQTPLDPGTCSISGGGGESELPTISQIVVNEGFTTLFTALDAAGLAPTFSDPAAGPFTVFAPNEDAFADLPAGTIEVLLADPTGTLTDILNYHVVDGVVPSSDVVTLDSFTTLSGETVTVSVVDGAVVLNDSVNVIMTDIEASNGIVHVVDTVLIPSSDPTPESTPTDAPATATPTDVPATATPTDVPATATPTDVPATATPTATTIPPTLTPTPEIVTVVATEVVVSGTIVITGTVFISVTVTPEPTDVPTATPEPTATPAEPTLLDLIVESEDHTILEQLIFDLNLETLLNDLNSSTLSYTVFAPDDETLELYLEDGLMARLTSQAEESLPSTATAEDIEAEVQRLLRGLILNHIVPDMFDSTALFGLAGMMTPTLSTLNGDTVSVSITGTVNTTDGALLIRDLLVDGQAVVVETSDIPARNGILHIVHQEVILPSSIGLGSTLINGNGLLPLVAAVALVTLTSTAIGFVARRNDC